eukprot:4556212-Amphidinium_carterae.1
MRDFRHDAPPLKRPDFPWQVSGSESQLMIISSWRCAAKFAQGYHCCVCCYELLLSSHTPSGHDQEKALPTLSMVRFTQHFLQLSYRSAGFVRSFIRDC